MRVNQLYNVYKKNKDKRIPTFQNSVKRSPILSQTETMQPTSLFMEMDEVEYGRQRLKEATC